MLHTFQHRLATLRARDSSFEVFGAFKHQYRLGPALTEVEVADFEKRYGFRLSGDLRQFLLTVGNGGAGPGYGVHRLGILAIPDVQPATLEASIVYRGGNVQYPIEHYSNVFSTMYFETVEELNTSPELVQSPSALTESVREPSDEDWDLYRRGTLTLADYGCGMTARLVVSGPSQGTIWVFDDCDRSAIVPFAEYASTVGREASGPFTFERWYDHWLESSGV